jgi:hypothetical protein
VMDQSLISILSAMEKSMADIQALLKSPFEAHKSSYKIVVQSGPPLGSGPYQMSREGQQ